jgi:alginate O-acetyltransferase complex protein AlgI
VLFPSITFLFYFLPLFFLGYCLAPGIAAKNVFLLLASLLFYAWGEPRFVIVLIGLIALNYYAALVIGANEGIKRSRATAAAVGVNLLLLGVFKYADFAVSGLNAVLPFGLSFTLPGLALPLGISFFTFHAISYSSTFIAATSQPIAVRSRSRSTSPCSRSSWPGRSFVTTPFLGSSPRAA